MRNQPEQALQRAVVQFLEVALAGNSWFSAIPLGGGGKVRGAILKGMGVKAGICDLLVINDGRCRFLEIKAPKGRVSAAQHEAHRKLRQAGATVDVCYSLDEVIRALLTHGVPLRGDGLWLSQVDLCLRQADAARATEPTRTRIGRRVLS